MNPAATSIDFNERPYIVIWEVTQACDLACAHCRASAQPDRSSLELSTDEGKRLIDEFAKLYKLSLRASFHIKTTEAQHYRRYVLQQQASLRSSGGANDTYVSAREQGTIGRAPRGLNDEKASPSFLTQGRYFRAVSFQLPLGTFARSH
jgi:hypothetical protein